MTNKIQDYIDKQAVVSAIERFSDLHDQHAIPADQKTYQELLPRTTPGQNEQYAFEVDMDKCTGCKACVTACHNENGLDPEETWRSVGQIQGGTSEAPVLQHITSACHHCVEPGCLSGCPTLAYTKDPATGVVKHLDDQCFGCQYCILKCPYDVPKYNAKRGIVHKCDMCVNRLLGGQAPACVRACPNGAIRITLVNQQEVKQKSEDYVNVPDAPGSSYTYPTTKYKTKRAFPPNTTSQDYFHIQPEHSHFPLVIMLVLTQLSVGAFFADFISKLFFGFEQSSIISAFHAPFALAIGLLALGASVSHLGRPHLAFRAFLGVRTSWLSREIISFGGFAKLAVLYAMVQIWSPLHRWIQDMFHGWSFINALEILVLFMGLLGVLCSVMVYRDTKRPFWDNHLTTLKFMMTCVILGFSTLLLTTCLYAAVQPEVRVEELMHHLGFKYTMIISIAMVSKLLMELTTFLHLMTPTLSHLKKTAILMSGVLDKFTHWRFACGFVGGFLFPMLIFQINPGTHQVLLTCLVMIMFLLCLVGEFLERYLFFRAVVPLKMPGNL